MSVVTGFLQRLGLGAISGLEIRRLDSTLFWIHRLHDVRFGKRWHSQSKAREFERTFASRKAINESYSRLPVAR